MINLSNITAGMVLGLVVTSATLPAFAAGQRAHHAGRDARAQSIEEGSGAISAEREDALRFCNAQTERIYDYTGANRKTYTYNACMMERGQPQ